MAEQKEMLTQIASAEAQELSKIVQAVLTRYGVLFPEEEVIFLSLPKYDQAERSAILHRVESLSQLYQ